MNKFIKETVWMIFAFGILAIGSIFSAAVYIISSDAQTMIIILMFTALIYWVSLAKAGSISANNPFVQEVMACV